MSETRIARKAVAVSFVTLSLQLAVVLILGCHPGSDGLLARLRSELILPACLS
jgi:hypothetical protein